MVLVAVGAWLLGSLEEAERGTGLLLRNVLYALPPWAMAQVSCGELAAVLSGHPGDSEAQRGSG